MMAHWPKLPHASRKDDGGATDGSRNNSRAMVLTVHCSDWQVELCDPIKHDQCQSALTISRLKGTVLFSFALYYFNL